ncbi:UNKNOWN [Stylonychia lemnae]|uniref:Uncharacterized protein n=1 Tax=Stylonychia lemnae TaxID=5949 RepID=A0A078AY61_STYLE|nr:UNKNOWN [Stylonychia lemnae]|eukprot:CDW87360.1 UNKNOWN [Stylonychia lemnae]
MFILAFAFMTFYGTTLKQKWIFYGGLILMLSGFLIICMIVVKNAVIKVQEHPTFDILVNQDLECYFDKINQDLGDRGMQWKVMIGHYWLELTINRRQQIVDEEVEIVDQERETPRTDFTPLNFKQSGQNKKQRQTKISSQNNEIREIINQKRRVTLIVMQDQDDELYQAVQAQHDQRNRSNLQKSNITLETQEKVDDDILEEFQLNQNNGNYQLNFDGSNDQQRNQQNIDIISDDEESNQNLNQSRRMLIKKQDEEIQRQAELKLKVISNLQKET